MRDGTLAAVIGAVYTVTVASLRFPMYRLPAGSSASPSGVLTPVCNENAGALAAVIGKLYASTRPGAFDTEAAYKRDAFTASLRYAVLALANGKLITFGVMIGAPVYGGA